MKNRVKNLIRNHPHLVNAAFGIVAVLGIINTIELIVMMIIM